MKIFIVPFLAAQIIFSCSLTATGNADERPIEGIYVMQTKGEASIADDTLTIKPIPNQKGLYAIERRVGYQRITEKGLQPREVKQEKATAIWYAESNQLKDQKRGRVYSLSTDGAQMLIGSSAYTRITNQ